MAKRDKFEVPSFALPATADSVSAGVASYRPANIEPRSKAAAIIQRHSGQLMAIAGVKSVGESRDSIGNAAIEIGIVDSSVSKRVPKVLDGVGVMIKVIGQVDAYSAD